ncbi:MAG TPA: AraC family transcriptional regulator [Pyrinomonadaceae bacterium]|jgi:AraC-like DNA-binding protein
MDRRVQTALDLIRMNLQTEILFDDVARSLNISPSRLRCLFKNQVGMSPSQYVKNLKMQKARELAETTFLNAKQIMTLLGINDQSHFTRDFKRVHGMTITKYRAYSGGFSPAACEQEARGGSAVAAAHE